MTQIEKDNLMQLGLIDIGWQHLLN